MKMKIERYIPIWIAFLAIPTTIAQNAKEGDDLVQPPITDSENGLLDITLNLEYANYMGAAHTFTNTRLLNGTIPGPTIRLKPGDKMRIHYHNKLENQTTAFDIYEVNEANGGKQYENKHHSPDVSNLHFHGAHVPGELPSDDIRLRVVPGDSFQFETIFPENHMPGTHWIHPHAHGSSALQLGGGAAMAMIVQDPPGYLPKQVEDAEDVLLLVQYNDLDELTMISKEIGDTKLKISGGVDERVGKQRDYRMVNGQYMPTITLKPGEWQRWRIVYGSWLLPSLEFHFEKDECEMQLLAKDGVYINDFPRKILQGPIPSGGRADIMVRCPNKGRYQFYDFDDEVILNVHVTGDEMETVDLERWELTYPAYLQNLQNSPPPDSTCSCPTDLDKCSGKNEFGYQEFCVNGEPFDPLKYIHTVKFGEIVERTLMNIDDHPYHQHVYPFQLVGGVDGNDDLDNEQSTYFREGDWHDVIRVKNMDGDLSVRYRADVHTGRIFMHCHRLVHEDRGMMAQELVTEGANAKCSCDTFIDSLPVGNATGDLIGYNSTDTSGQVSRFTRGMKMFSLCLMFTLLRLI